MWMNAKLIMAAVEVFVLMNMDRTNAAVQLAWN